nr:hypothetical protein BaRGS_016569 [Batillaria attramentaria]
MVRASFALLLAVAVLKVWLGAVVAKEKRKSIDQMIMAAAKDPRMFNLMHMMPTSEMMMMLELDMAMTPRQFGDLMRDPFRGAWTRSKRKAVVESFESSGETVVTRWDDAKVYYEINDDLNGRAAITQAIKEWETYTCLNFTLADYDTKDKVVFQDGEGCYSRLGKIGGTQEIVLGDGCLEKSIVIHEIGHTIGWIHEQARPDRDTYIRVNFNRIPDMYHDQFDEFDTRLINDYDVQYDYRSIMHYSGDLPVTRAIETLIPMYQDIIGMAEGLSYKDAMLANLMYNCAGKSYPGDCPTNCSRFGYAYQDKNCDCMCPGDGTRPVPCSGYVPMPTTPPPPPTGQTTTEPEQMECRDLRDDCAKRVEEGECTMNAGTMALYCTKSCDFCDKGGVCMDYEEGCSLLKMGGLCEDPVFRSHTKARCKKSCGFCKATDPCQMQHDLGLTAALMSNTGHQKSATGVVAVNLVALTLILFSN